MKEMQESIGWIQDAARGSATVGGTPIRQRVSPIVEKAQRMKDLGQEIATDGLGLLRDLVHERPMIVFSVVGATAFLLARFASIRGLASAASIGVQAAQL
ncbi:MAG: hypothetical protein ABW318_27000, partial [Vicinamibacterales bacterium]